jgi:16S rRNA (guanine527-N7)-methyltransferase
MQAVKDTSPADSAEPDVDTAPETMDRLRAFMALLLRWNATINLVGRGDADQLWARHVADSLRLRRLVAPGTARAIDLGSGAGFPGLVLAVATGIPFALVESDRRKAAFLGEAIRVTGAPATVHSDRIETVRLDPAPLVTARALAPLPRLLDLAHRLVAPGGACLFPKGAGAAAEIAEARRQGWRFAARVEGGQDSPILHLSDIDHA